MENNKNSNVRDEEAGGSNPLTPTIHPFDLAENLKSHLTTQERTKSRNETGTKGDSALQTVQNPRSSFHDLCQLGAWSKLPLALRLALYFTPSEMRYDVSPETGPWMRVKIHKGITYIIEWGQE